MKPIEIPRMRRPRERLTIADTLVLVAVTASGLLGVRFAAELGLFDKDIFRNSPPGRMSIEYLIIFGGPVLVAWTLAVLILSLWQSWPTLRHVARRPGFIACVMVVVALVDRGTYFSIRVTTDGGPINDRISLHLANSLLTLPEFVGLLISGAWLAIVFSGKWRRRPTGVDRVGCLLGLCWLAIFLANEVYFVVLLPLML